MIAISKALDKVLCMKYLVIFQSKFIDVLVDLGNEVNAMHLGFNIKLRLVTRPTNIGTQKIDNTYIQMYSMIIAGFSLQDSWEKIWFIKQIFLLADTSQYKHTIVDVFLVS